MRNVFFLCLPYSQLYNNILLIIAYCKCFYNKCYVYTSKYSTGICVCRCIANNRLMEC